MDGVDAFDRLAKASDGVFLGKLMNAATAQKEYGFMQRLAKIDPAQAYGVYSLYKAPRKVAMDKLVWSMGRRVTQSADGSFKEQDAVDGAVELDKCSKVSQFLSSVAANDLAQIVLKKAAAGSMEDVLQALESRRNSITYSDVEQRGHLAFAHLRAARNLFEGLAFFHTHSEGIIHRDIKPPNIVLASGTVEAPVAYKFIDFGLSVSLADAAQAPTGWGTRGFIPYVAYIQNEDCSLSTADIVEDIPSWVPRSMANAVTLQTDTAAILENAQRHAFKAVPALTAKLAKGGRREWQMGNMLADVYALAVVTLSKLYSAVLLVEFGEAPASAIDAAGSTNTAVAKFELDEYIQSTPKLRLPKTCLHMQALFVAFQPVHAAFYKFMYAAYSGQLWGHQLLDAYDEALAVAEQRLLKPVPFDYGK